MLSTSFDQCDKDKSGFLEKNEVIHVLEMYNAACPCKKGNADMDKQVKVRVRPVWHKQHITSSKVHHEIMDIYDDDDDDVIIDDGYDND